MNSTSAFIPVVTSFTSGWARSQTPMTPPKSGTFSTFVDITNMPPQHSSVLAGETWNFRCWLRDNQGGPKSNFTDGVAVTFK